MAIKSTIIKADLQIADMDRAYYHDHALTIAQHPSETDERIMVRVLAFALYADENLAFGKGLSADDEPDLWQKDPTGAIDLWIDVGLPDERAIRKACGRARQVVLMAYGGRAVDVWWGQNRGKLERLNNLTVMNLPAAGTRALAALIRRTMPLQCSIQDGQVWMSGESGEAQIEPSTLYGR
ncbi:MAG: YaeQ family protein [Burkholderiales bacterium]